MTTLADAGIAYEPLPLIERRYKSVRSSAQGRLSAVAGQLGTLDLQFDVPRVRGRRPVRTKPWRAGPLRSCSRVFDALSRGLTLLGEEPSQQEVLRLSRRIDRQLGERLSHFSMLNVGRYAELYDHVTFLDDVCNPATTSSPVPLSWVAAGLAGTSLTMSESLETYAVRETFVLVRRQRTWELWTRIERANAGSMPSRRHAALCSTELMYEEPALAAELLLFALLRRRGNLSVELTHCPAGLIPAERLRIIERQLATQA